MTNEEVVKNLNKVKDIFYFGGEMDIPDTLHTLNILIEALEENDKLKAEIERIKNESHRRSDMFLQEIEQLKSELEHAINLTPKICETCEYEEVVGFEEPCNSCVHCSDWELKGKVVK